MNLPIRNKNAYASKNNRAGQAGGYLNSLKQINNYSKFFYPSIANTIIRM